MKRLLHTLAFVSVRARVVAWLIAGLALLAASLAGPVQAQTAAPSNDRVADATTVGAPDLVLVDTRGATTEPDEPVPTCAPPRA